MTPPKSKKPSSHQETKALPACYHSRSRPWTRTRYTLSNGGLPSSPTTLSAHSTNLLRGEFTSLFVRLAPTDGSLRHGGNGSCLRQRLNIDIVNNRNEKNYIKNQEPMDSLFGDNILKSTLSEFKINCAFDLTPPVSL